MPGLSKLQQFKTDILGLGDEVKVRASRGEKPAQIPIPQSVQDIDDSNDFIGGLPETVKEEISEPQEPVEEAEPVQPSTPDVSDLLNTDDSFNIEDLDLSAFSDNSEPPAEEPAPEPTPIEDLDFESLMASTMDEVSSAEPSTEEGSTEDAMPVEEIPELGDDFFSSLGLDTPVDINKTPEPAEELPEAEELESRDFSDTGIFNADDIPEMEDAVKNVIPVEEIGDTDGLSENADFADINTSDFSDALDLSGLEDPNAGFDVPEDSTLDLNESLPKSMQEAPDPLISKLQEVKAEAKNDISMDDEIPAAEELSLDELSLDDPSGSELSLDDISSLNDVSTADDIPSMDDLPASDEMGELDIEGLGNLDLDNLGGDFSPAAPESNSNELDLGNLNIDDLNLDESSPSDDGSSAAGSDLGSFNMDFDTGSFESSGDALSPEMDVPEEPSALDGGTDEGDDSQLEAFDTSGIEGLDFGSDGFDGDDFHIPGFSDIETADLSKKTDISKPNFEKASEADEKNKPKNTFTDTEYERFLANLEEYPLNVRIALEDLVVKNEFTDEAVFGILEKVLRKAPARQVASELEKLLDISLNVPRDFEKRSAKEYENYKQSLEYQLKNRIIPGAILTTIAAIMIFCIFTLTNIFIYKPLRANSLYKQGYSLISKNQYPQSEDKFNKALTYKPVKKWFYKYAQSYADHKQYDRARMMYRAILQRYNHEKQAGLDWATLEVDSLNNYQEGERILKREVLDFHINDATAILQLGDTYLEWGTEKDSEKLILAKEQYDLYSSLYGQTNPVLARDMTYFIRTDNLRQVLSFKDYFANQKKGLNAKQKTELSGYLLDKRYGKLRPSEEGLRSAIEGLREILEDSVKADPEDPIAHYNMARYFIETSNGKAAQKYLENSIERFENQQHRKKRDTYKFINAYRLIGEEMKEQKEYLLAEEYYGKGISLFEKENKANGFDSDENTGHLYADLGDIDYFIACDNDTALQNYENAINNKWDNSSVRYKIGYIQYNKRNFRSALGSFIKSHDTTDNDSHLLLALANTLSLNNDHYVAKGYYERLINILGAEQKKHNIILPQVREDHADIVDTYMKASNNLGVTLTRLAGLTGNSQMNAQGIVHLQESLRAWDALTRNQKTMIRLEGSNLAEQNIKYIIHPASNYECEIYTEIPRTLYGEKGIE